MEFKGEKGVLDAVTGGGGGGGDNTQTILTQDAVEVILSVGEGPIQGLVDGLKSFYVGETPLIGADNIPSFYNRTNGVVAQSFWLNTFYGTPEGQQINSMLGGFGSATNVNVTFATNTPVTRTVTQHNIDFVDLRLVVNTLYLENTEDASSSPYQLGFTVEWKRASDSSYNPVIPIFQATNPSTGAVLIDRGIRSFWQASPPSTTGLIQAIWFETTSADQPNVIVNGSWVTAPFAEYNTNAPNNPYWQWEQVDVSGTITSPRAWQGNDADFNKLVSASLGAPRKGDYWLVTDLNTLRYFNGGSWVTANDGSTPIPPVDDESFVGSGIIFVTARITTSPVVWQVRFPVPNIDEDLNIRVTKRTASTSDISHVHSDTNWESYTATIKQGFSFPNLAAVQFYIVATNNFTSIPDFSGIYYGRIIKVPSNYNPTTRAYTGTWDGTWVMAYTDNPAYIVKDLVENTTYGMGAYYQVTLNDWDVYDAGQWCDHQVPDGSPRFTFNGVISDPRVGREAIDYICGIFAGRFVDDGNGFARILIDRSDKPATQLFTKENIAGGAFTYSWTDVPTRYNDLTVVFTNPDKSWTEDRRRLFSQPAIDQFGRIPYNFIAYGCITEGEAYRRGRYVLSTAQTETQIVTFKTARNGNYVQPYDIILIADDAIYGMPPSAENLNGYFLQTNPSHFPVLEGDAAHDVLLVGTYQPTVDTVAKLQTGRTLVNQSTTLASVTDGLVHATNSLLTTTDARTVILRDPVHLEPGFAYRVAFQTEDGPVEYDVDPSWTGTKSDLKVTTDITHTLPGRTPFSLRIASLTALPKPYRVISMKPDGDEVEITAIEVNRTKWNYVDGVPDEPEEPEFNVVIHQFQGASEWIFFRPAVDWEGRRMYYGYDTNKKIACWNLDTRELISEDVYAGTGGLSYLGWSGEASWLYVNEYDLILGDVTTPGFQPRYGIFNPATKTMVSQSNIATVYGSQNQTYCIDGDGRIVIAYCYTIDGRVSIQKYDVDANTWTGEITTGAQLGGFAPATNIWYPQYFPVTQLVRAGHTEGFYVNCGPGIAFVSTNAAAEFVMPLAAEVLSMTRTVDNHLVCMLANNTTVRVNPQTGTLIYTVPTDATYLAWGGTTDAGRVTSTRMGYINTTVSPGWAGIVRPGTGATKKFPHTGLFSYFYAGQGIYDGVNNAFVVSHLLGQPGGWYVELVPP